MMMELSVNNLELLKFGIMVKMSVKMLLDTESKYQLMKDERDHI